MSLKPSELNRIDVCHPAPADKRKYIGDIGRILVKDYGKKKYYKTEEVKEAHKKSDWGNGLDFSCWAMSTFSSHHDFDRHHEVSGEVCDYTEMKSTMLEGISTSDNIDLTSLPEIDLDASWLEFGDIFDGVLEGIGEFFAAIISSIDI